MEIEYIFGTVRQSGVLRENLKTKSAEHTELDGFIEIKREYPDCNIFDRFCVLDKYQTTEDGEGNCYDWYFIEQHYRYVDKTPTTKISLDGIDAQVTYTAMMTNTLMAEGAEE